MSNARESAPSFEQDICSPSSVAIYTPAKTDNRSEIQGLGHKTPSVGAAKRIVSKGVRNERYGVEYSGPEIRPASKSLHVGRPKAEGHYMRTTEASR